jgi:hypothetical protein
MITDRTALSARPLPYGPSPATPQPLSSTVRLHDRLGGLIHEYQHVG